MVAEKYYSNGATTSQFESLFLWDFAESVERSGFKFIGPRADSIRLMGNKVSAIEAMKEAGVPTVPGSNGPVGTDADKNIQMARDIGFPVIIKAAAGGGGP